LVERALARHLAPLRGAVTLPFWLPVVSLRSTTGYPLRTLRVQVGIWHLSALPGH